MDEKTDKPHFWHHMETTASRYPNAKWGSRNAMSYWMRLQLFEIEDVIAGVDGAADASPKFMPSAEAVHEHALKHERARKMRQKRDDERRPSYVPDTSHVPTDPDEAAQYIADAKDPYEQFARQCEVESKAMGLDPSKPTPVELGKRRARDMERLIGALGGKEM